MGQITAETAYHELLGLLRETNLSWVAEQVQDEIALGKPITERIAVTASRSSRPFGTREVETKNRTTSATFVGRRDYDSIEKFNIARDAIRVVVIGGVKIQDFLLKTLNITDADREISFVPGETGDVRHSYKASDIQNKFQVIAELDRLLSDLEIDVNGAD